MKKLFILLFLLVIELNIQAQTTKGTFAIGLHNFNPTSFFGGNVFSNLLPQTNGLGIGFGTLKEKYNDVEEEGQTKYVVLGLSVNGQYFVANNLSLGLVGNFSNGSSTYKLDDEEGDKSGYTITLVGPEVRYYLPAGEKTKVWFKGAASVGSVHTRFDGDSDEPTNLSQYGGGVGLSVFPTPSISIDIGMMYNKSIVKETFEFIDTTEYQQTGKGLAFDIGFGYFFNKS